MRKKITVATLTILALVFLLHAQTQPSSTQLGKFQLLSSPYTIWLKNGSSSSETTVFRIDTATGKTWKYVTGQTADGKHIDGWLEVPE
jgi:hypothetical protein